MVPETKSALAGWGLFITATLGQNNSLSGWLVANDAVFVAAAHLLSVFAGLGVVVLTWLGVVKWFREKKAKKSGKHSS